MHGASQGFFERVVETVGVAVAVYGDDGRFTYVNEAYADLFGVDRAALVGEGVWAVVPEFERDRFDEYWASFDVGETRTAQTWHEFAGTAVPVSAVTTCQRLDGEAYHFGTIRDVSGRVERERQLEVLARLLRHNLRNDMTVVRGHVERLASVLDDERVDHAADVVTETVDDLLATVDKQRDIVGVLTACEDPRPIDVVPAVRRTAETVANRHPDAVVDCDLPESATAVALPQFERAVGELVENALVHGDRTRPAVEVGVEDRGETVRVTVADDGPPIPEMELGVLDGDRPREPLYHGSGLGLWLVDCVVAQSGGDLAFAENDPRGNVVVVDLPAGE